MKLKNIFKNKSEMEKIEKNLVKINTKIDLVNFRNKVDEIDSKIINLLIKRFELCDTIANFKNKNDIEFEDKKREKKIFDKIEKISISKENNNFIKNIFETIISESKNFQKKSINKNK